METTTMSEQLLGRLVAKGWDPERVAWGRVVKADLGFVRLEPASAARSEPGNRGGVC